MFKKIKARWDKATRYAAKKDLDRKLIQSRIGFVTGSR